MDAPHLEWNAAAVRDGVVTVPIGGERPKGWKSTFERTVRLLGGGRWGEVSLKKDKVKVGDVAEGSEEELRFFLDGVIQEANAAHVETSEDDDAQGEDDEAVDERDEGDDADTRMTSRFREFGAD